MLKGPGGRYLECIVVTVSASFLPHKEVDALALVVPTTAYDAEVPTVMCDSDDDMPPEWKVAFFFALESGYVGSVRSTNKTSITLQPVEVKAVSGFARKQKETESAITEQADTASSKFGVCPRVVIMIYLKTKVLDGCFKLVFIILK